MQFSSERDAKRLILEIELNMEKKVFDVADLCSSPLSSGEITRFVDIVDICAQIQNQLCVNYCG